MVSPRFREFAQRIFAATAVMLFIAVLARQGVAAAPETGRRVPAQPAAAQGGDSDGPNDSRTPDTAPHIRIAASSTDWTMLGHNAARTGENRAFSIVHPYTIDDLAQVWTHDLGDVITSSAIIAGDSVFVGSHDRSLYALNARTGALKWKKETAGTVESTPAFADSQVFATSTDGTLQALDAGTGEVNWIKKGGFSASSPVVVEADSHANGRVYVGSVNGNLSAYDFDGNLEWQFKTGGPNGADPVRSSPSIAIVRGREVVFFGTDSGHLFAVDTATQMIRWTASVNGDLVAAPSIEGGRVFAGSRGGVMYAFDSDTGNQLWQFTADGPVTGFAAVDEASATDAGQIYFGAHGGHIYSLAADTGALVWSTQVDAPVLSSPALGSDILYIGAGDNILAMNPDDGSQLWSAKTRGAVNAAPSLSQAMLFVGSADNNLYAFGLRRQDDPPSVDPLATPPPGASDTSS
ncbi:PQQ-binding-like beta-propeller repeat protein [Streptomyces sp. NPDC090303]|uniref:outer membrane protein assembly factor BamB family protein n=1 Tax=Streptomyces sp. NPDC090303 TaxID=3365960 RepID=UPI0037F94B08